MDSFEGGRSFYVNELHGTIKFVTGNGKVGVYAKNLINFTPIPQSKSDESGISGLLGVPGIRDLVATLSYLDSSSGLLSNRIIRLVSDAEGKQAKEVREILDLKEFTSPSNQIQQAISGADGRLYVSVGDGENPPLSLDLTKFGGKILRMNFDGTACEDNPLYEAVFPDSPRSYIYSYGLRNVFDMDVDPRSKAILAVDNGKANDRLVRIEAGACYGWNGQPEGTLPNAMYT